MNTNMVKRENGALHPAQANRPFGHLVSSLIGQDMGRWLDDEFWGLRNRISPNTVPVNIRETDKTYGVEVIAPGLQKSDFRVSLQDKQLTIAFDHKDEAKESDEKRGYLRQEYRHQSFTRSFSLDDTVDAANITAAYTDGVLRLTLPKKEEAQKLVRTVEVQ